MDCYWIYAIELFSDEDWRIGALAMSLPGNFLRTFLNGQEGFEPNLRVRRVTDVLEFVQAINYDIDLIMPETFSGQPIQFYQGQILLTPK